MMPAATGLLVLALALAPVTAPAYEPTATDDQPGKARVFVLSDMGNEPDDLRAAR